jgi:hypothetical protein
MNSKFKSAKNIVPKIIDTSYPTKRKVKSPEKCQPTQTDIEITKLRAALIEAID